MWSNNVNHHKMHPTDMTTVGAVLGLKAEASPQRSFSFVTCCRLWKKLGAWSSPLKGNPT